MKVKCNLFLIIMGMIVNGFAQQNQMKPNAIGTGYSCSVAFNTPAIAHTPFIFFKPKKHEVYVGLDIYKTIYDSPGVIFGVQGGYHYYLRDMSKNFNAYVSANCQYVQFGQGAGGAVPYNYRPMESDIREKKLIRTQSFSNTYGAGLSLKFLERFHIFTELAAGFNYSANSYSPTNQDKMDIYGVGIPGKIKFTPLAKLGLSYKIYSW